MDPIDWLCVCWACFTVGFAAGVAVAALVAGRGDGGRGG